MPGKMGRGEGGDRKRTGRKDTWRRLVAPVAAVGGAALAVLDLSTCGVKGSTCTAVLEVLKSDMVMALVVGSVAAVMLMRFRRVLIELAQYAMELHSDSHHCAAELSMLKEELEGVTDRVHEVQAVTPSGKGATLA